MQIRSCNSQPCPQRCRVSRFSGWSNCTASPCGVGFIRRTRAVIRPPLNGGRACPALSETKDCFHVCPQDCEAAPFSEWTRCSLECGGPGREFRFRPVLRESRWGGAACPVLRESRPCSYGPCKPDDQCRVSAWSNWTRCTAVCAGGVRSRNRTVVDAGASLGKACPELVEQQPCHTHSCPINCVLGQFGSWSQCSQECGGGLAVCPAVTCRATFGSPMCS